MKNANIEAARVLAVVAVVALHVKASGLFGSAESLAFVVDELSRFAVPMFFIFSGFLWKAETPTQPGLFLRRLATRVFGPYMAWVVIYLIADQTRLFHEPRNLLSWKSWIGVVLAGLPAYHLWFLPALWFASAFILLSMRLVGVRGTLFLAVACYVSGSIIGAYSQAFGFHPLSFYYRNGITFGALFVLIGYLMQRHMPPLHLSVVFLFVGIVGQLAEGYFLGIYPNGHDFSVSTIFFAVGAAGCTLGTQMRAPRWISSMGRYVFTAYLAHLMLLWIYVALLPFRGAFSAVICIAIVSVASMLFAFIYDSLTQKRRLSLFPS